jgi:hypothetical protein
VRECEESGKGKFNFLKLIFDVADEMKNYQMLPASCALIVEEKMFTEYFSLKKIDSANKSSFFIFHYIMCRKCADVL